MIAQFKKFSRKCSLLAAVIIVGLGIIRLTGAKDFLWQIQQKNNLSKGDEIVVAGNKAKVLDEMYLVIQFYP